MLVLSSPLSLSRYSVMVNTPDFHSGDCEFDPRYRLYAQMFCRHLCNNCLATVENLNTSVPSCVEVIRCFCMEMSFIFFFGNTDGEDHSV